MLYGAAEMEAPPRNIAPSNAFPRKAEVSNLEFPTLTTKLGD
jgi:hypothetical protein